MEKALREAKVHTSWMNPAELYEAAVSDFLSDLLSEKGQEFTANLSRFVARIADSGFVNSLAQLLLKMTVPGVPDFYQGTELWDFSLVDPDNRRPVDFGRRRESLRKLLAEAQRAPEAFAASLSRRWPDPEIKLWITARALGLRREWPDVFTFGDYLPLATAGDAADHVVSFARHYEQHWTIVAVPRHFYRLTGGPKRGDSGAPQADWRGTKLILPEGAAGAWRCDLSGRIVETSGDSTAPALDIAELFRIFPVALLTSDSR